MKKTTEPAAFVLLSAFAACLLWAAPATGADELSGRIAFLMKGEVWTADKNGKEKRQMTTTGGKAENYLFSPSLKYLAYTKIIEHAYEPGLWEEEGEPQQKEVYSIVIIETESGRTESEIKPVKGEWIYPEEWLPGDRLLFYSVSGAEVSGFFEYDAPRGTEREIEYGKPAILSKVDFSRDGKLMLYVEDTGQGAEHRERLHIVDLDTKEDTVAMTRTSIESPRISHGKEYIAFIEVERKNNGLLRFLRVYDRKGGSVETLFTKTEEGGAVLAWSFNDTHIGIWSPPEAVIVEFRNPDNVHTVSGTDFHWASDSAAVFARGGSIYLYDLDRKESSLLLKDASKPVFLRKAAWELRFTAPGEKKQI